VLNAVTLPAMPRHERCHERRESEPQDAGRQIVAEHHGDRVVVIERAVGELRQGKAAGAAVAGKRYGDHSRKNDEDGYEHFWNGPDERSIARGRHGLGGHGPLDDEKIGAPVTERKHEPESHDKTEPLDAHRIVRRRAHVCPAPRPCISRKTVGGCRIVKALLHPRPSARVLERDNHQRDKSGDDQKELQYLIVDR
jgi:hypothetical protein